MSPDTPSPQPQLDQILAEIRDYAERRHPGRWRWASVVIDLGLDVPSDVISVLRQDGQWGQGQADN